MLLESGQLEEHHDHFELTGHLQSLAVPSTLHDSLMARLDRLAEVKWLAQLAATLGREFSYALLKAVCGWGDDRLRATLDRLVEGRISVPGTHATTRGIPVQACAYPGGGVSVTSQVCSPRTPSADREHTEHRFLRHRRRPSRTARTPLHRSWIDRAGDSLLAQRRTACTAADTPTAKPSVTQPVASNFSQRCRRHESATKQELALHWCSGRRVASSQAHTPVKRPSPVPAKSDGPSAPAPVPVPGTVRARLREDRARRHAGRPSAGGGMPRTGSSASDSLILAAAHWMLAYTAFWQGDVTDVRDHSSRGLEYYSPDRHVGTVSYNQNPGIVCGYLSALSLGAGLPDAGGDAMDHTVAHARALGHPFSLAMCCCSPRNWHSCAETPTTARFPPTKRWR